MVSPYKFLDKTWSLGEEIQSQGSLEVSALPGKGSSQHNAGYTRRWDLLRVTEVVWVDSGLLSETFPLLQVNNFQKY